MDFTPNVSHFSEESGLSYLMLGKESRALPAGMTGGAADNWLGYFDQTYIQTR